MKGETVFARPLLVVVFATLIAACTAGASPTDALLTPGGAVALRTQAPQALPTKACMAALIVGTLVRDAESGVGLRDDQGVVHQVVWPSGYSARDDGGRLVLTDENGGVIAHEGDRVSIGGGEIDGKGTWLACGGTQVVGP
jgi:hypothetical protein